MDNDKIQEFKNHVKRHKKIYIVGSVIFAGITLVIMRRRVPLFVSAPENSTEFNIRPLAFLSKQDVRTNIVNVLEREGRGHPGYLVRCLETDEIFPSQAQAAEAFGGNATTMTSHLLGKYDNFHGFHFERVGIAMPNQAV